jgi:hypothetical protein
MQLTLLLHGLQDSAIYCLGLYKGVLKLFGLPVNLDFASRVGPVLVQLPAAAAVDVAVLLCMSAPCRW